jgi:aspartate/methionine/tyrosine aminotransferase
MERSFVTNKLQRIPSVPSRAVDAIARELKKKGVDVLNLSGAPWQRPAGYVLQAARDATRDNIYPSSSGIPELREAISLRFKTESGMKVNPETEILITNGGMQALYVAFTGLINPGDKVLIPSPCFFFNGIIELVGGIPQYCPNGENNNFAWDIDKLEKLVSSKTKMLVVNTPVNPTGYVATKEDLTQIARIAEKHNLLVLSDESYDKQIYDGLQHHSAGSFATMKERTLTVKSFTKSYAMPTWRIGYITGNKDLIRQLRKIHEWMTLYCGYVAQKAATAALTGPQGWVENIRRDFESNRNFVYAAIAKIPQISWVKPQGGPYIFLNISRLNVAPEEFSGRLLREFGIPAESGSYFQSKSHVRIPFGGTNETLHKLIDRLKIAVRHYVKKRGQDNS